MKTKISILSSALIGVIFGLLSNYSILKASWINIVVWSFIGILIGIFIENQKYIRWSGIFYGFFLSLSFLISGFQGSSSKIIGFTIFSIILSAIGAFCAWGLVFIGNWIKRYVSKKNKNA